jgi:hypothetical protein
LTKLRARRRALKARERAFEARRPAYQPFAPGIIMKDPTKGFTQENCLLVHQAIVDLMNDEMSLDEYHDFARRMVSGESSQEDTCRVAQFCKKTGMTPAFVVDLCSKCVANLAM